MKGEAAGFTKTSKGLRDRKQTEHARSEQSELFKTDCNAMHISMEKGSHVNPRGIRHTSTTYSVLESRDYTMAFCIFFLITTITTMYIIIIIIIIISTTVPC